jgi:hypothetical protein
MMLVLPVTASCSIKEPSIFFYQLNDGSDFQLKSSNEIANLPYNYLFGYVSVCLVALLR